MTNKHLTDDRDAILCFLANSRVVEEADFDIDAGGRAKDNTQYIIYCPLDMMAQLVYDLGIVQKLQETPWDAIQRHLKETNREEDLAVEKAIAETEGKKGDSVEPKA